MTTYNDAAYQGYQRLLGLYDQINFVKLGSPPNGFWLCANISNTIVAYMIATPPQNATNFVDNSLLGSFESKVHPNSTPDDLHILTDAGLDSSDYWLDDYGWWGNALLYALQYRDTLGLNQQLADRLLTGAKNCWIIMNGGWDRKNTPPIPGGVWNCDRPDIDVSGRNCVTNEVYWLMSLRLYMATQDQSYLNPSSADWFIQAKDQNLLFIGTAGKEYLVGERFKGERNWNEGWYWAGDQGLFRQCCLMDQALVKTPGLTGLEAQVYQNVTSAMEDDSFILHDQVSPITKYEVDYATGKGVFMWSIFGDQDQGKVGMALRNSAAVWNNRQTDNPNLPNLPSQFRFNWNPQGGGEPPNDLLSSPLECAVLQASGLSPFIAVIRGGQGGQDIPPISV